MAEERNHTYQPVRQYLVSEGQLRTAFVLMFAGLVALLLVLLFLATSRPQSRLQALAGDEARAGLQAATARLEGYEVMEDGRARIDISRAIELVAERGVVAPGIVAAGQTPAEAAGAPAAGEPDVAGAGDGDQAQATADGAAVYAACAACHQQNGQGLPGAFPPLAGHAAELYSASRDYLADVVLYGLMGQITVDGMVYNGLMPAHQHLSDAELAAVLNHVLTEFGNDGLVPSLEPYTSADLESRRGQGLSPTDVYAVRQELGLD